MSCGCSSVHTPPTITSCNATYNVCTGKSFYINVIGCADPIVTIPAPGDIEYPLVGLLEYSEINKKIYYTHDGSGVAITDSFTYTVVCNGISKTCTITVNIDDSISVDTTIVELDGCCIPTYTAKVYGNTVYSVIVDNTNILNTSYTSDTALSTYLNTYINVNGTFTVTKTTVSDIVNWTIVLTSNTKVLNSVTGLSLVQAIKTLCGCKLGDVEYTWTIPDCATLVPGYSVHDCKIQVIVPLYDALDDACCPIELTVRCGNCTSNCEKTETYNWCPPIYENCQTPDCSIYPCTTYNPLSGNCDYICEDCENCCGGNVVSNVILSKTCTQIDSQNYEVLIESTQDNGEWVLASNDDLGEGNNCLIINSYQVFNQSIITSNNDGIIDFIYIDNRQMQLNIKTDNIPITGGGFMIGYKIGICIKWYAFQILSEDYQSTTNHCNSTFVLNNYWLEHNSLIGEQLSFCNNCPPTPYYCAECCDNSGCGLANCPEVNQPVCVGQECVCYLDGIPVDPLPSGCCPSCTEDTDIPNCYTCVDGVILPPSITCPNNTMYNYTTCQCDCDCTNGYCYNVLTQICEPCPVCTTIPGLYTCNGVPYESTLAPCTQCINNVIVPNTCASGSIPNPYFNPNSPVSVTNPCCVSLTPCDCDNPTCPGQGTVCTHIEGSEECYCVDCTSLSCTNTSVVCEEVNGCDCVGNTCVSGCPTCTGTVSIKEYCTPFFVKFEGCSNNNYRFKVYELTNLLEKPVLGCDYQSYLDEYNNNNVNLTDITASIVTSTEYNITSSVFFNPAILGSGNYITIPKDNVQTMLIKVVKYGIETIYEFVLDENTCLLASEDNSDIDLIIPANPRIFRETCKFIYSLKSTGVCPFTDYEWTFPNTTGEDETAQEIQDGKYIVIFPPDFPLGTTRQVCASAEYIYDEIVCYVKEACKDYTPCTGGCGCDPCTDPNSSFITSIETITDAVNGIVNASASVLINCNGTLGGTLATCEPASSNENCSPGNGLVTPNNNGTSPLPFSAYENYDYVTTPCSIWECTQNIIGCEISAQAPCGWMYDDANLEVLSYNGANIKVGFINGAITGKLCWGARYECGYVCSCKEITKILSCEDYGITDVSINCTPTSTNVGSIVVTVNNYSDPYKIEVYKQGTPNTLLGTYPPSPATSIVTSPYTITIPESWGITNGDELIIKVIMLVDGLDCDYEETITYSCCVTPTIGDLSVLCNNNTGEITSVTFTTNTAGNPYNIYINESTASVYSGTTIVGTNTHLFNQGMPNVTNVKVVICDDNTTDCCVESSINVVCSKNCTITGADIVITCADGVITSVEIEGTTGNALDTYTVVITNTSNIAPNTVTKNNQTLPYTLTAGELATLTISDGDMITAVITVTGEPTCTITVTETIDCSVDCNLVVGTPISDCEGRELQSITYPITSGDYPITVTGTITYNHDGIGLGDLTLYPNVVLNSGDDFVLLYPGVDNNDYIGNCMSGSLTFTDDTGCVETITTTCTPCTPTVSFKCDNGNCYDPGDGTGTHTTENACKNSCPCTAMTLTSVTGCLANNTVNIIPAFTAACNDIDNNIAVGNIVSITDDNTPSNSWTITPDPLPLLPQNYTITYPQGIAPGTYNLTANWVCGVCNGNTQFTVTITTILITVSNITNDCNAQSPSSVNLYSAIQGGNNTNTIFRIPDINGNPVCDSSGTLTGGTLLGTNIWTTAGINTIYYEYTDSITQCKKCGSFEVTITDCCTNSMTIGDVSGCLSDGSVNINAAFAEACIGGGITVLVENNALSNAWGIIGSYPNYTISYPPSIIPGTYELTATWECGTCTDITEFNVTINPNPSVTATSHTDVCPFDLNLLLTVSPTGGTTIFKTGSTCQNGTLSGGTDIMFPTNYNTNIPNQAIQYQYTINGCSVCGEFTVTCCSANAGDDTNQTYCY